MLARGGPPRGPLRIGHDALQRFLHLGAGERAAGALQDVAEQFGRRLVAELRERFGFLELAAEEMARG